MAYTDVDNSTNYFRVKIYNGDGTDDRNITWDESSNMQPDMLWSKRRDSADNYSIYDIVRGSGLELRTNTTDADLSRTNNIQALQTNGFQVGTDGQVNASGGTYVSWGWLANNTSGSSNTNGSITSTVSANTTSGFSIVSYTGTGSDGATVGHGLGATPACIIIKNRTDSAAAFWCVYHQKSFVSQSDPGVLYLNDTGARSADTNVFGLSTVTIDSDVFSLGNYNGSNGSGDNMIAYCFAEKQGFSKMGVYTGNGSTDGTFIYTGFKPAFVLTKWSTGSSSWYVYDNRRSDNDEGNPQDRYLRPNVANGEGSDHPGYDFVSNGFKNRNGDPDLNVSGRTYIYMAFAENPFVTSTGIAGTAR
jgi:hypothetical protein